MRFRVVFKPGEPNASSEASPSGIPEFPCLHDEYPSRALAESVIPDLEKIYGKSTKVDIIEIP